MMMISSNERKYYDRHIRLPEFGEEKQLLLKRSKVLVIGAGGLGCPALQYLVAAGVGTIGILDGDTIDISNLHRQILFSMDEIGQSKAEVAAFKLRQLNPFIEINALNSWLSSENAIQTFEKYDVIVDCSDNFGTRYLVNDTCVILNKPFVYGAITKFEGQVSVFNYQDGPTYRCLFPDPPSNEEAPNCAEIGVLGVLPGIIGSYQALECVKLLSGLGEVLNGKLLLIDTLTNRQNIISFPTIPANKEIKKLGIYDWQCPSVSDEIDYSSYLSIKENEEIFLLDVREEHEYEDQNIGGYLIPLGELQSRLDELPRDSKIVVMCHAGVRSQYACELLREKNFDKVYNLKGGIIATF